MVQERIAGSVDELDALGTQGVSQRRGHVVGDEECIVAVGSQLVDHCPQRGRAQTPLDLGEVAKFAPAEPQAESGIRAGVAASLLENPELQAEQLHRFDRLGEEPPFGLPISVHETQLSMERGHVSIVDARAD